MVLLSVLTIYDWLAVTARFSRGGCLLPAMAVALDCWFRAHDAGTLRLVRRTNALPGLQESRCAPGDFGARKH